MWEGEVVGYVAVAWGEGNGVCGGAKLEVVEHPALPVSELGNAVGAGGAATGVGDGADGGGVGTGEGVEGGTLCAGDVLDGRVVGDVGASTPSAATSCWWGMAWTDTFSWGGVVVGDHEGGNATAVTGGGEAVVGPAAAAGVLEGGAEAFTEKVSVSGFPVVARIGAVCGALDLKLLGCLVEI